ncbi:MAG: hypothetical protein RR428_04620 [Coprobacillus sp.]
MILGCSLLFINQLIIPKLPAYVGNLKPYYSYTDISINKKSNIYLTKIEFSETFDPMAPNDLKFLSEDYYIIHDKKIINILFEQLISEKIKYDTDYADICYYNDDRFVALKDNQILECSVDNVNNINDILKYYFK